MEQRTSWKANSRSATQKYADKTVSNILNSISIFPFHAILSRAV
jgi:hypothetical protein